MASQIRTCFITAPAGSNLEVLAGALRRRNIHIVVPQQLSAGTELETEKADVLLPSIKDWLPDLPLWQARPLVSNLGDA